MFIPRGKAVHENLATSYVQVDALVADLQEGGFSGVVEVVLRDTDSFVVINTGKVAAVLEKSDPNEHSLEPSIVRPIEPDIASTPYARTSLARLAERARLERGRVSIYGYAAEIAGAVARRINAKSLYVGLSTDFTDLEKMILKLIRERDREWFVDINTEGVPTALIHLRDGACRIMNSDELAPNDYSDPPDFANNKALRKVLLECSQIGATFDVYFSQAGEAVEAEDEYVEVETDQDSGFSSLEVLPAAAQGDGSEDSVPQESELEQPSESLAATEPKSYPEEWDLDPMDLIVEPDYQEQAESLYNVRAATANHAGFDSVAEVTHASEIVSSTEIVSSSEMVSSPDTGFSSIEAAALDPALGTQRLRPPANAETMAEAKRLMGEIARTIENAAQAVDRPESFAMSLRAGQLKVADRYPFLDPFAGEIEYLTGEIVFVGKATVEEFVAGLAEALKLAVEAVMKSTSYPDRFRAYLTEDLQKLLARERHGLETSGLDQVIADIIRF